METVIGKLTPAQYWQWREFIEEMHHAETKEKLAKMNSLLMEKDIETGKLRLMLQRIGVKDIESATKDKKKQYQDLKQELETLHGISLNSVIIDEVTFEVKMLTEEIKS